MINSPNSLEIRTTEFSKRILIFCKGIAISPITRPIIDQLVRSATSIGANYAEANNAASRTDFRNKIFIAKKEAAETKYWLILLYDLVDDKETCKKLEADCQHLLMTLQKIINTLRSSMAHSKPKTY